MPPTTDALVQLAFERVSVGFFLLLLHPNSDTVSLLFSPSSQIIAGLTPTAARASVPGIPCNVCNLDNMLARWKLKNPLL